MKINLTEKYIERPNVPLQLDTKADVSIVLRINHHSFIIMSILVSKQTKKKISYRKPIFKTYWFKQFSKKSVFNVNF